MARYCFYCGRELTTGEKCACRTSGASSDGTEGQTEQKKTQRASASASGSRTGSASENRSTGAAAGRKGPDSIFKRFIQFFNPFAPTGGTQSSHQRPKAETKNSRPACKTSYKRQSGRPGSLGLNWQRIKPSLVQAGQYLVRPADSIGQAALGSVRQPLVLVLVLKGIGGGFFLLSAAHQSFLQTLLSLNVISIWESSDFLNGLSIFTQGFIITLADSLFIALLYYLALRFLFRNPTGFQRLMNALCPSFFYTAIFFFASLLTLSTSVFNAAMLLLVGFAVSALAQFLAMRKIMGMDDNRSLSLVVLIQILYSGVLAILLNLALPLLRALVDQSGVI
jgi:hypothetical protein